MHFRVRNTFLELVPCAEVDGTVARAASAGPTFGRFERRSVPRHGSSPSMESLESVDLDLGDFNRSTTDQMHYRPSQPVHQPLATVYDKPSKGTVERAAGLALWNRNSSETMSATSTALEDGSPASVERTSRVSAASSDGSCDHHGENVHNQTDAMICSIPCRITSQEFGEGLDRFGLKGTYDSVYLPQNSKKRSNYGYAFVHFLSNEMFCLARDRLNGQFFDAEKLSKPCQVKYAHLQGQARPRAPLGGSQQQALKGG